MAGTPEFPCAIEYSLNQHLAQEDQYDRQEQFMDEYITRERDEIEQFVAGHGFLESFIEDNRELVDSELEYRARKEWNAFIESGGMG